MVVAEVAEKPALGVVGSDAYGACCRVDQDDAVGVGSVVYDVLGWVPYSPVLLVSGLLTLFLTIAYTMFNVFLPKMLETASPHALEATPKTLEQSLWDVVIFTVGGCPGAIVRLPYQCISH